jgi:hypothetical protein
MTIGTSIQAALIGEHFSFVADILDYDLGNGLLIGSINMKRTNSTATLD